MGTIEQTSTGHAVLLRDRHLVGRSSRADLALDDPRVSGEHAVILWDRGWWVRDLGSRNGTFVQGRRLGSGEAAPLVANAQVGFGSPDVAWVLSDDASPAPRAEGPSGVQVIGHGDLLALPTQEAPQATVFRNARGRWVVEDDNGVRDVDDGDEVEADGGRYRLTLPDTVAATARSDAGDVDDLMLRFAVSHDEEYVLLELVTPSGEHDLGSRSHHYLLLTLARARIDDAATHAPVETHGWLYQDELARGLGVDLSLLTLHVYRARKQLADLGVPDAARLVERRPTAGTLRLGIERVEIVRR